MTTNPISTAVASDLAEGKKLAGSYVLKKRLPSPAGMETWSAQDEVLGKDVSLHFLPATVLRDKIAMNALRQEVKRTRALIHPNILRVYDLIEEADWGAIAMDTFEGESLAAILKSKHQLDPAEIEPWIGGLCKTLEEAHKINLVHRDLAPENVFVGGAKGFFLAGFGTSRVVQDAMNRADDGGISPRSSNLSPQLLDAQTPTASDDVYGLGALLFELLAGQPVFANGDIVQQIRKVVPPSVSEVRKGHGKAAASIPPAWDETIVACLSKEIAARPPTPAQIAARLAATAAAGTPAVAPKKKPAEILAERAAEFKAGGAAATSAESTARASKKKPAEILAERAAQHKAGIVEEKPVVAPATSPVPPAQAAAPETPKKKPAEILAERAAQFRAEGGAPQKPQDAGGKPAEKSAEKKGDKSKPKPSLAPPGSELFVPPRRSRSPVGLVAFAAAIVVGGAFYYHHRQSQTQAPIAPRLATTEPGGGNELTSVNHSIPGAPEPAPEITPATNEGAPLPPIASGVPDMEKEAPRLEIPADAPSAPESAPAPVPVVTLAQNAPPKRGVAQAPAAPMTNAGAKEPADHAALLEKLKQDAAAAEKAHQEKVKLQQEADAVLAETQKAIGEKTKEVTPVKKAVEGLLAARKKREDEQKIAEAAAQAAQQAAAEKVRVAEEAKKALSDFDTQNKEKLAAHQQAEAELLSMQQALADRQKAAADAAQASADADALRQQQAAALKDTEQEVAKARVMAEKAAAEAEKKRASIEAERQRLDQELAAMRALFEQKMKDLEERRRQIEGGAVPPTPTSVPAEKPAAVPSAEAKPAEDPALALAMKTEPEKIVAPVSPADTKAAGDENSLGHRFVKVGDVYFSVWQTRVKDFETFAKAVNLKSNNWRSPGFRQESDHPVVNVTWNEAIAFCKWLTEKERKEGRLSANQFYRLPTDLEWSAAVGLSQESGRTPEARDMGVQDLYPWGAQWPPPEGAGNYTGEETGSDVAIKGYNDKFPWTAPVGSFLPNKLGLYDMGGNVWQWCMDTWNNDSKAKVLRGASWYNGALKLSLLASCRVNAAPDSSTDNYGFRIVRATESGGRSAKRP